MKNYILSLILLIPNITFAQLVSNTWTELDTILLIISMIKYVTVGAIVTSLFLFFLNFSRYIKLDKNDEGRERNKKLMIRCIVTIIIALFLWQTADFLTEATCCVLPDSGPIEPPL